MESVCGWVGNGNDRKYENQYLKMSGGGEMGKDGLWREMSTSHDYAFRE